MEHAPDKVEGDSKVMAPDSPNSTSVAFSPEGKPPQEHALTPSEHSAELTESPSCQLTTRTQHNTNNEDNNGDPNSSNTPSKCGVVDASSDEPSLDGVTLTICFLGTADSYSLHADRLVGRVYDAIGGEEYVHKAIIDGPGSGAYDMERRWTNTKSWNKIIGEWVLGHGYFGTKFADFALLPIVRREIFFKH